MKMISILRPSAATIVIGCSLSIKALACGGYGVVSLDQLAKDAVSSDPAVSAPAISALRTRGPAGLDALFRVHEKEITAVTSFWTAKAMHKGDENWLRLKAALEAVSQQRDCEASKLFWYTDFHQAKVAAQSTGKPILSLRLLGNLNEEYSCANSRFFRTTLYANSEVSAYLRDHFILHWKSVRPIPRITVDFGDGRKIERTITGNSIHYILDAKGRVVDALPGLYGARAFLDGLKNAEPIARASGDLDDAARALVVRDYHNSSEAKISKGWARDLAAIGDGVVLAARPSAISAPASALLLAAARSNPPALKAASVAASKSAVERPLLKRALPSSPKENERIKNEVPDEVWEKIAALHAEDASLDRSSQGLIHSKSFQAEKAAVVAIGKRQVEDPLIRSIRNLERSISEDTVRNEYLLHSKLHEWLAQDTSPDLDQLNSRVYADLFLSPDSDPWLGLVPADIYSALDNDGLVVSTSK